MLLTYLLLTALALATDPPQERLARYIEVMELRAHVFGGWIEPRWLGTDDVFHFAERARGGTVVWRVDPASGVRARAEGVGIPAAWPGFVPAMREEPRRVTGPGAGPQTSRATHSSRSIRGHSQPDRRSLRS